MSGGPAWETVRAAPLRLALAAHPPIPGTLRLASGPWPCSGGSGWGRAEGASISVEIWAS